jgi:hypothetical protein
MKSIAIFFLFIGIILIINGYYRQKYELSEKPKIIVKYIPRTLYDDQLSDNERLDEYYQSMFDTTQPGFYNDKIKN